eukprot:5145366-Amphidinium_carterae.1
MQHETKPHVNTGVEKYNNDEKKETEYDSKELWKTLLHWQVVERHSHFKATSGCSGHALVARPFPSSRALWMHLRGTRRKMANLPACEPLRVALDHSGLHLFAPVSSGDVLVKMHLKLLS